MIYRYYTTLRILLAAVFCLLAFDIHAEDRVHIVMKGETLFSISRSYKVSLDDLMRHNKITAAEKLWAGAKLAIPSAETRVAEPARPNVPASSYFEYTVSQRETLYSIARSRGVTLQALREVNGFSKTYVLKAGEKIRIPNPAAAVAVTAAEKPDTRVRVKADQSIRWPIAAKEIIYMDSTDMGVLIFGERSASIKSLTGGTVVYTSPMRGFGEVAVIATDGGYTYTYGACESLSVKKGDRVEPGTELGKLGIYPGSGRPELVLKVSKNGPVDPVTAPRL